MTFDHIKSKKPIEVNLASSSTVKGVTTTSTRSGVAGAGSLEYNVQWQIPKSGVIKNRKDLFQQ